MSREQAEKIVQQLEFGCPFIPGSIGEKDATMAEVVMQLGANCITSLLAEIDRQDKELSECKAAETLRHQKYADYHSELYGEAVLKTAREIINDILAWGEIPECNFSAIKQKYGIE